jgi:hypothetical protein
MLVVWLSGYVLIWLRISMFGDGVCMRNMYRLLDGINMFVVGMVQVGK